MYLNNHSYYSLRYGTMPVETLIEEACKNNVQAMALTDINNTTGIPDFVKKCREKKIHPIPGIEFRNKNKLLYIVLAKNATGFREMNEFLSTYNEHKSPLPLTPPCLPNTYIIYPFGAGNNKKSEENEFIGITPHELNKLAFSKLHYPKSKLIIRTPVTFKNHDDFLLHQHLRAIDANALLTHISPEQTAGNDERFIHTDKLMELYRHYPYIIKNTEKLISNCSFDLDLSHVKNKKTFTGSRYDDKMLLTKLAREGIKTRYKQNNKEAERRVSNELDVIDKLGFSSYFLITWDIIRYSLSRGFYHVGRGSGANSIVAYCLNITNVDPIELNLYFERFINPKRTSPPDFDIDYSWKIRDEVQDYIFKRYGKRHTALLGTITTFSGRSVFRELGKVYGLPKEEIDLLVNEPGNKMNNHDITERIHFLGSMIINLPNQRSIHAGGVLVSEEPITCYTALDFPPKGMPTTQWDMHVAEDIGFEKIDILGQRGIGHIKECVDIVKKNKNTDINIHDIEVLKNNQEVKKQLKAGETLGCFYIESPAMRGLLKKLRCDDYIRLVAASSIIRPGVAKSGMMKEYIRRFHAPGNIKYLHPVMKEHLAETYGVMVYQEDVIKICHHFAGLGLSEADILRRAMSGKLRSKKEFSRIRDKFFANCDERGYPANISKEVWRQMESFAGYSFSKAHSASYAVESLQSLYLKTHFPLEFMVAVINNFGGFYQLPVYVNEARRWGAVIELPCVNSSLHTTCIKGRHIYLGFIHIMNMETSLCKKIVDERQVNGTYENLESFTERVPVSLEQLILLIRINAFRFTGKSKKELLWQAHFLLSRHKKTEQTTPLFRQNITAHQLPPLEQNETEDAYDETELLGFPVSITLFDMLKTSFRGEIFASEMLKYAGRKVRMMGNLVHIKNVRTKQKEWMHFGTFLDAKGQFFDTVNFPNSLKKYPFRGPGIYLILGKVEEEFGFPSLTVEKMAKLPLKKISYF